MIKTQIEKKVMGPENINIQMTFLFKIVKWRILLRNGLLLSVHLGISCLMSLNLHVALKILQHECFRKYQAKNNQKVTSVQLRFLVYINFWYLHPLEFAKNVP